jgi:hypothetical protein
MGEAREQRKNVIETCANWWTNPGGEQYLPLSYPMRKPAWRSS